MPIDIGNLCAYTGCETYTGCDYPEKPCWESQPGCQGEKWTGHRNRCDATNTNQTGHTRGTRVVRVQHLGRPEKKGTWSALERNGPYTGTDGGTTNTNQPSHTGLQTTGAAAGDEGKLGKLEEWLGLGNRCPSSKYQSAGSNLGNQGVSLRAAWEAWGLREEKEQGARGEKGPISPGEDLG